MLAAFMRWIRCRVNIWRFSGRRFSDAQRADVRLKAKERI